jgi:hypothetical protein
MAWRTCSCKLQGSHTYITTLLVHGKLHTDYPIHHYAAFFNTLPRNPWNPLMSVAHTPDNNTLSQQFPIGLLVSMNPRMSKDFVSILPLNFMYVRYLGFLFKPIQNVHYTGTSLVLSHTCISRRADDCMRQPRNSCLSFYRSVWVSFQAKSNKI